MTTYVICGPTSSGKSSLALDLALYVGGSVINADSMQLYQDFPVLSGQPFPADQKVVPHFLYGLLSVQEVSSVTKWLHSVKGLLNNHPIRHPIFVGGTGFYLQSLLDGLSPIPDVPSSLRVELNLLMKQTSLSHVFSLLEKHDPESAKTIGPYNPQKIIRALEVTLHTEKPFSVWKTIPKERVVSLQEPIIVILIDPDRDTLCSAINNKVVAILKEGALQEVLSLKEDLTLPSTTAVKILGYEEISSYLDAYLSEGEMIEQIQNKTRQYAKRQMTWFRHQIKPDFIWPKIYDASDWTSFLSKMKW